MRTERDYPDFDPEEDRILLRMPREKFLELRPESESGQVIIGGIRHYVSYENNQTILTPVTQKAKLN